VDMAASALACCRRGDPYPPHFHRSRNFAYASFAWLAEPDIASLAFPVVSQPASLAVGFNLKLALAAGFRLRSFSHNPSPKRGFAG